jgi:hypothetical protein
MRVLREVGVGTHRGDIISGTCSVKLAVFWRGVLVPPLDYCALTFSGFECGWNETCPGRKWGFLLFDVWEVFRVVFRK